MVNGGDGVCRKVARRLHKRRRVSEVASDTIDSVNLLEGRKSGRSAHCFSKDHNLVHGRVLKCVNEMGACEYTAQGAFEELRGAGVYAEDQQPQLRTATPTFHCLVLGLRLCQSVRPTVLVVMNL